MALNGIDAFQARIAAGYGKRQHFWGEQSTATSGSLIASGGFVWQRLGYTADMPSLPSGVTAFIPTSVMMDCSITSGTMVLVCKQILLGSLNLSSGTFTDGSAMPTQTVGGQSLQLSSFVMLEVTTALNSTPGNLTITYVDQSGNTAETTGNSGLSGSAPVGTCSQLQLNSGDYAVQDVTNAATVFGSSPSGVIAMWGCIPICFLGSTRASTFGGDPGLADLLTTKVNPLRFGAGDSIGFFAQGNGARALRGVINLVGED